MPDASHAIAGLTVCAIEVSLLLMSIDRTTWCRLMFLAGLMACIWLGSTTLILAENITEDGEVLVEENEVEAGSEGEEKNPEDPTKIVTRLGAGFNGDFTINASWGLDKARMISGFINEDASEWRLGGSWLFDKGIVNFNFKKNQYDDGGESVSYNIGTFVPLSVFGIEPCGWQIFPSAGFNYTEGDIVLEGPADFPENYFLVPFDTKGVYLGAFALKPVNDQWTLMGGLGGSYGSGDATNVYGGAGIGFRINEQQSVNLFYSMSDSSDFGSRDTLSFSYRYEFK